MVLDAYLFFNGINKRRNNYLYGALIVSISPVKSQKNHRER